MSMLLASAAARTIVTGVAIVHLSLMSVRHTSQLSGWHKPGCLLQSSGGPMDGGGGRGTEPFSTLMESARSFPTAAFRSLGAGGGECSAAADCWPVSTCVARACLLLGLLCCVGSAAAQNASSRQHAKVAAALAGLLMPFCASAMQQARGGELLMQLLLRHGLQDCLSILDWPAVCANAARLSA